MSDRCQGCKMLRMTVWLCIMILNGSVTLSGSPFDCLWHSFLVNLRIWDDWWKLLYQNCNFRNMLLVPRNLSAIFRSRSSLLYTGTTGPCLDEMSPPLKRVYPLMRCTVYQSCSKPPNLSPLLTELSKKEESFIRELGMWYVSISYSKIAVYPPQTKVLLLKLVKTWN